MIKAMGNGKHGEPVLVLAFSRADIDIMQGNATMISTIRSKSGVEANIIIAISDDEETFKAKLGEQFGGQLTVTYAGPLLESGEVIRTS